jgi:ferritin heavy chain
MSFDSIGGMHLQIFFPSFLGFSLSHISGNGFKKLNSSSFCNLRVDKKWGSGKFTVCAATTIVSLTGVIFEPFEEVKKDYLTVPIVPQVSLARQNFSDECESVINEQIK